VTGALMTVAVAGGAIAVLLGVHNWRRALYWLLLYLPFAGIPTILLYPAPDITRILKDICFVVPAYLGFAAAAMKRQEQWPSFPASPLLRALCGVFVVLVLGQALNPHVSSLAAAGVGVKTWLFYIPLVVLGFNLAQTRIEVERVFRWMLLAGLLPVAIGITQSLLISVGRADLAYMPYGDAAAAVTQEFSQTNFGVGQAMKAPGVFTFITQYYNFLLAIIAVSFTVGLAHRKAGRRAGPYFCLAAIASLASFLCGSRGAFITVPLLLGIATILSGNAAVVVQTAVVTTGGLVVTALAFGTTLSDIWRLVSELLVDYAFVTPIAEFATALNVGYWGIGTGYNTGPARLTNLNAQSTVVVENYLAKAVVELGLVGLLVLLIVIAMLLVQAASAVKKIRDPQTKVYGCGIFAFLIVSVVNFWKGSYLDIDPLNVYFWLLTGILLRLPTLKANSEASRDPRRPQSRGFQDSGSWRRVAYARGA
jgi:hypothetical protein